MLGGEVMNKTFLKIVFNSCIMNIYKTFLVVLEVTIKLVINGEKSLETP